MAARRIITYVLIEDNPDDEVRFIKIASRFGILICRGCYRTVQEAVDDLEIKDLYVDVLFCDVELFDLKGLDYGGLLTKYCRFLTFVTAFPHHEDEVLRSKGDACIIKPVTELKIQLEVFDRLYRRHGEHLPITIEYGKLLIYDAVEKADFPVAFEDIVYVKVDDNYVSFYVVDGKKRMARTPLVNAMRYLDPVGIFLQVTPGTVVNTRRITRAEPALFYIGDQVFKVTDKYKEGYNRFRELNGL